MAQNVQIFYPNLWAQLRQLLLSSEDKMTRFSSRWKFFEGADDGLACRAVVPQGVAVKITLIMIITVMMKVKVENI